MARGHPRRAGHLDAAEPVRRAVAVPAVGEALMGEARAACIPRRQSCTAARSARRPSWSWSTPGLPGRACGTSAGAAPSATGTAASSCPTPRSRASSTSSTPAASRFCACWRRSGVGSRALLSSTKIRRAEPTTRIDRYAHQYRHRWRGLPGRTSATSCFAAGTGSSAPTTWRRGRSGTSSTSALPMFPLRTHRHHRAVLHRLAEVDFVYHLASPASPIDYLRPPLDAEKVGPSMHLRNTLWPVERHRDARHLTDEATPTQRTTSGRTMRL